MNHTRGPWEYRSDDIYVEISPHNVIRCMSEFSDVATAEDYANARLIAAAPELLALIQMAFDDPDSEVLGDDWNRRANAVITKATGAQP